MPAYGRLCLHADDHLWCRLSIGPAAFNSAAGQALAKKLPRDRVVPESDGPFAQVDGASVMPWGAGQTAQLLGMAWDVTSADAMHILESNSRRLLGLIRGQGRSEP
ncbi:TatD family hydrolase [Pseudomonas savastanoi]|uniref:TatD family hydrolase n=1 Tax=Pseudomonas savastanoi TaxID=29438 RepID=UPI001F1A16E8|nr:TatD family hydrolase [Pseudomonas savastanoi]